MNVTIMSLPSTKPLGRSYHSTSLPCTCTVVPSQMDCRLKEASCRNRTSCWLRLIKSPPQEPCALQVVDFGLIAARVHLRFACTHEQPMTVSQGDIA
jgi:hypothetical protein